MDRRTDLRERIAERDGMEPVSRAAVARSRLENELAPDDADPAPDAVAEEETLVVELVDRKPIAARTFRPPRPGWFRPDLSPADLADAGPPEDLVLVQDRPDGLPWVADGTHTAAAQLLAALRGEPSPGQEACLGVRPESEP
jgi:hypothetical protein